MPCLGAYIPSGIRTHDPLITSWEHKPLHHRAPNQRLVQEGLITLLYSSPPGAAWQLQLLPPGPPCPGQVPGLPRLPALPGGRQTPRYHQGQRRHHEKQGIVGEESLQFYISNQVFFLLINGCKRGNCEIRGILIKNSDEWLWILTTANTASRRRGPFCPRLRMRRMNTLVTLSTNSFWLP